MSSTPQLRNTRARRRSIKFVLAEELYYELVKAAAEASCETVQEFISPEEFAREAVESVLADRRAHRIEQLVSA